jgi:hypothetical protein
MGKKAQQLKPRRAAMIRVIENSPCCVIQKLTHKTKVIGYQIVPKGGVGDTSQVTRVSTLTEARDFARRVNAAVASVVLNSNAAQPSVGVSVDLTESRAA